MELGERDAEALAEHAPGGARHNAEARAPDDTNPSAGAAVLPPVGHAAEDNRRDETTTVPGPSDADDLGARLRDASTVARDLQAEQWRRNVAARLFGARTEVQTIGRYRLLEQIGVGSSGEVWAAIDPELDRKVALKVLHDGTDEASGRAAMVREAKSLAKLSHPNVVPVFDAGVHEGRVFVALELVEGTTMRAWLATSPHWTEVATVFAQAARGLIAAHTAGIVHRDFKPENVLIGSDGRVRVSDFGIARAAGAGDAMPSGTSITSTAGIGTPAYMAPEQFLGDSIDARTDQFGFCVALHEALYGERPFHGRDRATLAANITAGRRRAPPNDRGVPRWLEHIVVRGTKVAPHERFDDMSALLRALERPSRRGVRPLLVAASIALGVFGLASAHAGSTTAECEDGGQRLDGVWDRDRADAIRRAFAATARAGADARAEAVVSELDGFGDAWRAAQAKTCDAELDEPTRIAQQYCLHTRLLELDAMVDAFAEADDAVVERTASGATTLRSPAECLWIVSAPDGPTRDPEQDLELRAAIASARAYRDVGTLADGLVVAADARRRAQDLGDRSLEAEALLVTAELQNPLLGSVVDVDPVATLHAAVLAAEAAHRPDLIALARVATMEAELQRGDFARVHVAEGPARVSVAALGDPPELIGRIELSVARALIMEDDDGAMQPLERARDHFERGGPSSRQWLAQTLNLIGESRFDRGDYLGARPDYARALEVLGEDPLSHRIVVANTSGNLAETYFVHGDFAIAERYFEESLRLRREVFGEDSVWVRHSLGHLADVAWERGEAERALALYAAALGSGTPLPKPAEGETVATVLRDLESPAQQAWMRNGVAAALIDLGRFDEALAMAESVPTDLEPTDPHHPDRTSRADTRGLTLLAMGRAAEAVPALDAAVERLTREYPADARSIGFAWLSLGRAQVEAGDSAAAIASLERGLAFFTATPLGYRRSQAAARFALGRARLATGDATRGRQDVQAAIALLDGAAGTAADERDAMQAWLAAHP